MACYGRKSKFADVVMCSEHLKYRSNALRVTSSEDSILMLKDLYAIYLLVLRPRFKSPAATAIRIPTAIKMVL